MVHHTDKATRVDRTPEYIYGGSCGLGFNMGLFFGDSTMATVQESNYQSATGWLHRFILNHYLSSV